MPEASTKLYTPTLLALATGLSDYPLAGPFQHNTEVRSRTCGSVLRLGADCDADGRITRIGMQVSACAVGQSAATIMARSAKGRDTVEIAEALTAIEAWLAGKAARPDWPGFDALEPAQPHTGRHGALVLPWKALHQALSSQPASR